MIFLAFAMAPVMSMSGSASPVDSTIHSGCDHHSSQDDTGVRLCSMSVCHPGVAAMQEAVICAEHKYAHDTGVFLEAAGVRPDFELPPPRSVV
ncbi:hypothetical protein [Shinella sp.]|uniref:hypothetical protein n=1 Tax=Shinella sp. TaxID=1870904 RepID=UPI003F71668F